MHPKLRDLVTRLGVIVVGYAGLKSVVALYTGKPSVFEHTDWFALGGLLIGTIIGAALPGLPVSEHRRRRRRSIDERAVTEASQPHP